MKRIHDCTLCSERYQWFLKKCIVFSVVHHNSPNLSATFCVVVVVTLSSMCCIFISCITLLRTQHCGSRRVHAIDTRYNSYFNCNAFILIKIPKCVRKYRVKCLCKNYLNIQCICTIHTLNSWFCIRHRELLSRSFNEKNSLSSSWNDHCKTSTETRKERAKNDFHVN